jgi:mono/diheme cytochrome c family protein
MKLRILMLVSMLALSLSACLSLAEDITPPPGYASPTPAPTLGALYPAAAPNLAQGKAIFAEKCAPCHGPTGLGDGAQAAMLPVNLPVLAQPEIARRAVPAAWYALVTQGNIEKYMPSFASLSDQERWNVVAYAQTLHSNSAEVQAGQAIYAANCALCHGPDGKSAPTANFTDLQWVASRALDDQASAVRQGIAPNMPAFADKLADADIYAALAYTRTFAFGAPVAVAQAEQATPEPAPALAEATSTAATPQAEGSPTLAAPVEPVPDSGPTTGLVRGLVSSPSGGDLPSGLTVTLHGFDHNLETGDFSEVLTLDAKLDAKGKYAFSELEMPKGRAFYVSLDYSGITYSSEVGFVQDGLSEFDLPVTLYETSTDTAVLVIEQAHVLLDFTTPEKVTIIHFLVFTNPSEKTLVAETEGGIVASFNLPANYENLQFEEGALGGRFLETTAGFGDTLNIAPGSGDYQLVFAYDLPYTAPGGLGGLLGGGETELSLPFAYAAKSMTLLLPEGVTASGPTLSDDGVQSMGGSSTFQMYSAGALEAGQDLVFKFFGSPKAAADQSTGSVSNQNIIIGVGVLGLVLIAVGAYLFWRDRRLSEADDEEDTEADPTEILDENEILDAIVALDDQFKAGKISEAVYRERRAELKAKFQ